MAEGGPHPAAEAVADTVESLWRELSGSRHAIRDRSLLTQGADSLLLVALLAELEDHFGVYVSAEELLADPTIDGLARLVRARSAQP